MSGPPELRRRVLAAAAAAAGAPVRERAPATLWWWLAALAAATAPVWAPGMDARDHRIDRGGIEAGRTLVHQVIENVRS